MLLVVAAIGNLVSSGGRSFGALILLVIGVALQLDQLDWFKANVWSLAWPALIIVIGVRLLSEPRWHPSAGSHGARVRSAPLASSPVTGDRVSISSVMSGRKERIESRAWTGGEVTAFMGGVELHLADAAPVEQGAWLRVNAVMGGVDIYVPRHWEVVVHGTPLLGGVDDRRHPEIPAGAQRLPRLIIDATIILGGIGLKDDGPELVGVRARAPAQS